MALLADGLHMGSHAVALGIAVFAYAYARKNAGNARFSFGTGKVNALGGFAGAILLAGFALYMVIESIDRFIHPVAISFNGAIIVAAIVRSCHMTRNRRASTKARCPPLVHGTVETQRCIDDPETNNGERLAS